MRAPPSLDTGIMGAGMARNLLSAGFQVRAWNRTRGKAEALAELARAQRIAYVDGPVLGTKQPAESGQLVVLTSGPDEARESARPGDFLGAIEGGPLDSGKVSTGRELII